jgi:hypothetical protein
VLVRQSTTINPMSRILKSTVFWLFLATALILFSFKLFFGWGLMVGTLFSLFFIFRWTRLEAGLSERQHRLYLITMMLYPIVETGVQWMQIKDLVPDSWTVVNRLEHFCWATALTLLFLPLITQIWQRLEIWQSLLFIVGFVCLLGNLNEFLEYFSRIQGGPIDQAKFAWFYVDTIYDMMMNLLGSLAGFALLLGIERSRTEMPE